MKLGHVSRAGQPTLFAQDAGKWIVVSDHVPDAPASLDSLISQADVWLGKIAAAIEHGEDLATMPSETLAPFASAPTVIAIGLNYSDHCREFGVEPPTAPVVFVKLASSILPNRGVIEWRESITQKVDWEAELGVIIGRDAREVSPAEALDYVFGYTVINDVTARDIQGSEQQWVRGKSLDTFCPIGPVVVTADDIPNPQTMGIRSKVNGEVMQDSNTSEMIFSVAELISRLSHSFTLRAGDVIATGTPLGVGAFRTPPKFLQHGDVVEVEVDGIGSLTNTCHVRKEGK